MQRSRGAKRIAGMVADRDSLPVQSTTFSQCRWNPPARARPVDLGETGSTPPEPAPWKAPPARERGCTQVGSGVGTMHHAAVPSSRCCSDWERSDVMATRSSLKVGSPPLPRSCLMLM